MTDATPADEAALEAKILELTAQLYDLRESRKPPFEPGKSKIPYAGRVFEAAEVQAGVKACLDAWLTLGPEGHAFEAELAEYSACATRCWSTRAPARTWSRSRP